MFDFNNFLGYYNAVNSQPVRSAPTQPVVNQPTRQPTQSVQSTVPQNVPWNDLHDPMQDYYWESALGGKTVKTRDMLGYDNPLTSDIVENMTLEEIMALENDLKSNRPRPIPGVINGNEITSNMPEWFQDSGVIGDNFDSGPTINYDSLRQFGDWQDTNIQDFYNDWDTYFNPEGGVRHLGGDDGYQNTPYWNDLVDIGDLDKNKAFNTLRPTDPSYDLQFDPRKWLADEGIDLREWNGWDPSMGIAGEDPHTRAMQATIMKGYGPDTHWRDDLDNPKDYQAMLNAKINPFDPVAFYLNDMQKQGGVENPYDFFNHPDQNKWEKDIKKANPSKLKKFASTPAFGVILGGLTAGLLGPWLTSTLGSTFGAATPYVTKGLTSGLTGGLQSAAGGGDFLTGFATGGITGGLNQFGANYLSNSLSPVISNDALRNYIAGNAAKLGTNTIMGKDPRKTVRSATSPGALLTLGANLI